MLLKLVWILITFGGKYHQENAKNRISERLDFEIFWGSMPQDPPKSSHLRHFRNCLGYRKTQAKINQNRIKTGGNELNQLRIHQFYD